MRMIGLGIDWIYNLEKSNGGLVYTSRGSLYFKNHGKYFAFLKIF